MSEAPSSRQTPYAGLAPEVVLDALDSVGFVTDGRLSALNSYENRVYQIGCEDLGFVVAKFYRPGRWSRAQIAEEHAFTAELAEAEIPVVAPLARDGQTLFTHREFLFAVFPRRGGRPPELEHADAAQWMGRTLGRLHLIGARANFRARPSIDLTHMIDEPARWVVAGPLLPAPLRDRYLEAVTRASATLVEVWSSLGPVHRLRLHGDCHPGNVLWTEAGPTLVDFDDARAGPAVQDLWMLLNGEDAQRAALLEGYEQFRPFDHVELSLIPALRLMRQIHYAGWLSQRWRDPAFPAAFPWAAEARYWETHLNDVREAADELR